MRSLNPDIQVALAAGELRPFVLIGLTIDGTDYRFTDCDVPIGWNGVLYQPRGLSTGGVNYSLAKVVDSIRLGLDNLDDQLSLAFIGGEPQGSPVRIRLVVLDTAYQLIGAYPDDNVLLFSGTIDDWSDTEGKIEFTVTSDLAQWGRRTLRMQSSGCSWAVFKGVECGYSGPESSCNRTYASCLALGNTANFGGERWLPSLEGKQIIWGARG